MKKVVFVFWVVLSCTSYTFAQLRYEVEFGATMNSELYRLPIASNDILNVSLGKAAGIMMNGGIKYGFSEKLSLYSHIGYFQYRASTQTGPFINRGQLRAPYLQTFIFWNALALETGLEKVWWKKHRCSVRGGIGLKYGINTYDEFPEENAIGEWLFDVIDWRMEYELSGPHTLHLVPNVRLNIRTKRAHDWYLKFSYAQGLIPVFKANYGFINLLTEDDVIVEEYDLTPFNLLFSYYSMSLGFTW